MSEDYDFLQWYRFFHGRSKNVNFVQMGVVVFEILPLKHGPFLRKNVDFYSHLLFTIF
jgi:hypothetical protein